MTIVIAVAVATTAYMYSYSSLMDLKFGEGKRIVDTDGKNAQYYTPEYSSLSEAVEHARDVTREISSEGIVLLKNNGVLPLDKGDYVSPFGYHYLFPNYQPSSGSAVVGDNNNISAEKALKSVFAVNAATENAMKNATPYGLTEKELFLRKNNERADIIEYDPQIYSGTEGSCSGSAGIVFIGRTGGEGTGGEGTGGDMKCEELADGTPHGAALSDYERKTIAFAKSHCDKVVVVLNCCNVMQIGELTSGEHAADAILWIGGTGSTGFMAMTDILTGEVNPSGRLPDSYMRDATKSPAYVNYGDGFVYSDLQPDPYYHIYNNFVEYEEGVYYGYRYYETAYVEDPSFVYGSVDCEGETSEAGEVIYPFGYGLSYTSFQKEIAEFDYDEDIRITVKVKNTGAVAGKDVVQVYYTPPYTSFSANNGIEKPAVSLAGFAKTKELAPGEETFVTIEFALEDMASWFSLRRNGDGTRGCYFLEKGEYIISLRNNSHDIADSRTVEIDTDIYYDHLNPRRSEVDAWDGEDVRSVAAVERFPELTEYMNGRTVQLSRSDWSATTPTAPTDFSAPRCAVEEAENTRTFDPYTDSELGNVEGSRVYSAEPVTENADNGLVLSDLRGADFNDPEWENLLDQIDYDSPDFISAFQAGYMSFGNIDSVGLHVVQLRDGPLGIKATGDEISMGVPTEHNCYSATPVLAATFNRELAYKYGEAVAAEALLHNEGNLPISFIYAPAINIHRCPFGGRYYEYFSEDPLLTGLLAASYASGAADNGLMPVLKHFAANNQDLVRDGLNTWMSEQTLREIYLKSFEICIKTAKTTVRYINEDGEASSRQISAVAGIMTAKNCIGASFCGSNAVLLQDILRGEWNFKGFVICDFITGKHEELYQKMVRSGVNVIMAFTPQNGYGGMDCSTGKNILRNGLHYVGYAVANSNAMQGVPPGGTVRYGLSAWKAVVITTDCVLAAVAAAMVVITIVKFRARR